MGDNHLNIRILELAEPKRDLARSECIWEH